MLLKHVICYCTEHRDLQKENWPILEIKNLNSCYQRVSQEGNHLRLQQKCLKQQIVGGGDCFPTLNPIYLTKLTRHITMHL